MKSKPYHSKLRRTKVYHTDMKCTLGNNIERRNRVSGKGKLRLCRQCRTRGRKHK